MKKRKKKMSSPDEYENIINLLKEALRFYADPKNYEGTIPMIDHDEQGSQARFALKQAEDLTKQIQKMQDEYDKLITGYDQLQVSGDIADVDKLKQIFKLIKNEDNNI